MPTKLISKALLGALSAAVLSAPAFAGGHCGGGNCAVPVHVLPSMPAHFGPMTIQNQNPLGHLKSIHFQRAPHVSITRIHSLGPTAALSDAPSGFTGGCHPSSTTYCRQGGNHAAPAPIQAPALPAPVVSAPPVSAAPVVVRTGGGYDPVVVPGTGTAPNLGMVRQNVSFQGSSFQNTSSFRGGGLTQTQGLILAPTRQGPSFGQPSAPVLQQSGPLAGTYGSSVAADGTYWEKVSGPTAFGDTVATSVICKRQAQRRVVRPVVNVPVPVPVAVPQVCRTTGQVLGAPAAVPHGRYGQSVPGRWVQ